MNSDSKEPIARTSGPRHALDRRVEDRRTAIPVADETEVSPEWETRAAISAILDITLGHGSFRDQLREILDVVISVSWLKVADQGAIFVANSRNELILTVEHNLAPQLVDLCSKVRFGQCLCGKAAERKEILFKGCVDSDHDISFEGMQPHGHYSIPLMDHDNVLGAIVLYTADCHEPHQEEKYFMELLGLTLSSFILNRSLKCRAEVSKMRLQRAQEEMVQKLVAASEFKDKDTGTHIRRMSQFARVLAEELGLEPDQVALIESAAPMHDVGKVGIPDDVLLKTGRLTAEELAIMQQHPVIGGELLKGDHPLLQASREIALTHHERWDGKGYPKGLAGTDIPLFGRICSLVDVFDALTSVRPYKEAWSVERALGHIKDESGSSFEPRMVKAFESCLPEILKIKEFYDRLGGHNAPVGTRMHLLPVEQEYFQWNSSLEVGVDFVDLQHEYLVNLIDRMRWVVIRSETVEVAETLLDMNVYAEIHFREEEELMRDVGYPGFEAHCKQHEVFMQSVSTF
ncbi:MAG: HD domain-containing protein [Planctomycetes bacterium]|nr:HD domain-containing protein [Planctomycetota bacterium]